MKWFKKSKLDLILEKLEELLSTQGQGLTDLQNALAAETVQSALVVSTLQGLAAQIAALQAQIATLQSQQGEVTDAQLETLAQGLTAAEASVAAALPASAAPAPSAQAKEAK